MGQPCKTTINVDPRDCDRGTLSFTAGPGTDRVRFTGRLSGKRRLKPGLYTLLVVATNTARQRSVTRRLTFTIVRRRR
jgi:hypothetical protein